MLKIEYGIHLEIQGYLYLHKILNVSRKIVGQDKVIVHLNVKVRGVFAMEEIVYKINVILIVMKNFIIYPLPHLQHHLWSTVHASSQPVLRDIVKLGQTIALYQQIAHMNLL